MEQLLLPPNQVVNEYPIYRASWQIPGMDEAGFLQTGENVHVLEGDHAPDE
jgi:hypothetical protein